MGGLAPTARLIAERLGCSGYATHDSRRVKCYGWGNVIRALNIKAD